MRIVCLLLVCFGTMLGTASTVRAGSCDGMPDVCRGEALRIESAYRAGLAAAATPDERLACIRVRNEALGLLVDRTYQAALVWVADRSDLLSVLQRDQALWQARLEALAASGDVSPAARKDAQEKVSALLLDRLRVFGAILANGGLR